MTDPMRRVVIIGAGVAGLTAAYRLSQAGWQVTLLDAAQEPGGLASSLDIEGTPVERFYHFICRADDDLIQFMAELGIREALTWRGTRTAFFHEGRLYPFGTPFDLLRFSAIPWMQRFRFGIHIITSRYRAVWKWLDQIPAKPWLIENIGEQAYQVIWHPLLSVKFGADHDRISAAWIWHRIWRVAKSRRRLWERESFGYLENGSQTLIDTLLTHLRTQPGCEIRFGQAAAELLLDGQRIRGVHVGGQDIPAEAVLSTAALPALADILPQSAATGAYQQHLRQIKFIGVVTMLFSLKRPFSPYFWMNINDARIPFNGIIEVTNLNQNWQKKGLNLLYVPLYISPEEMAFSFPDEQFYEEYMRVLRLVRPDFNADWVKEWRISRSQHAQAVCTTHFATLVPELRAPLHGLYVTDSTQFYPEDRTLSAAIRLGNQAAHAIQEDRR